MADFEISPELQFAQDPEIEAAIRRRAQEEPMILIFTDVPNFDHPERVIHTAKRAGRVVDQWLAVETAESEVVDDKDKEEK